LWWQTRESQACVLLLLLLLMMMMMTMTKARVSEPGVADAVLHSEAPSLSVLIK
jgi:hypothetical protein